jgi:flagellar biogenesis protein FliO
VTRPILPFLVVAALAPAALAQDDAPAPVVSGPEEMPSASDIEAALAGDAPVADPMRPPPMELSDEKLRELPPPSIGAKELLGPLAKTMLMLCVVLGIVYLTLHKGLGKLLERQSLGKRMKVVERVALDTKRTLYLVDVDGKQMVLAAGEGGVVVIKHMEPDASAPSPRATFAEVLNKPAPPTSPPTETPTPVTGA